MAGRLDGGNWPKAAFCCVRCIAESGHLDYKHIIFFAKSDSNFPSRSKSTVGKGQANGSYLGYFVGPYLG